MPKTKKNSNYVTDKTIKAKADREAAARKKKIKKTLKPVLCTTLIVLLIVGAILGIGAACGMFRYHPEVTHHININVEYKGDTHVLHIELYGKDAPETVETFVKNASENYYDNQTFHTFLNGLFYGGNEGAEGLTYNGTDYYVKGEFSANGHENKIKHERGILSMSRGEAYDSGFGQFFIVTEDAPSLDGYYAAFGRVTDGMDFIDEVLAELTFDNNGRIAKEDRPIIKSITVHAAH